MKRENGATADDRDRHDRPSPSTQQIARWFDYKHLQQGPPQVASAACALPAIQMIKQLPDSAELVAGLRKLLEAKDCFVRAAIAAAEAT